MNNSIFIIYKKVGKIPLIKKVQDNINTYTDLLGDNLAILPYKDILIIHKKDNDRLRPNIHINEYMKLGISVKGDIIVVGAGNKCFKSLTKKQILEYRDFLIKESFKYSHFDKKGRYISTKQLKEKRKTEQNLKKNLRYYSSNFNNKNTNDISINLTLSMILKMQNAIIQFIQEYTKKY